MNNRKNRLGPIRYVQLLLLATLLLLVMTGTLSASGGGGDGGGGGGNEASGSVGGPPDIWNIDPAFPNGIENADGTISLKTPLEQNLQMVWEGLGGEDGTGQSLEEWLSSERAEKAVVQEILEQELAEAQSESASSNTAYVVVEKLDEAGQVTQLVLSFCPAVGAGTSVGLDAGRTFAEAYGKARAEGKSTEEAIQVGFEHATAKGLVTAFTAGTIGNAAGKTWEKMNKIPLKRVVDVAKKGSHVLTSMGAKTVEFATNAAADEIRGKTMDHAAPKSVSNHAPQPAPVPLQSFTTVGGHHL